MKSNPYRTLGVIFVSIAAVELVAVVMLALLPPSNARLIALPFAIQCPIFGTIGAVLLFRQHRRNAQREQLIANGYYEIATVIAIEQNYRVRVNGRCPYHVVCRIERDGTLHEYRSEGYAMHPGIQAGDLVPVYLDRRNDKAYYVDVDSVAPQIVRH